MARRDGPGLSNGLRIAVGSGVAVIGAPTVIGGGDLVARWLQPGAIP